MRLAHMHRCESINSLISGQYYCKWRVRRPVPNKVQEDSEDTFPDQFMFKQVYR